MSIIPSIPEGGSFSLGGIADQQVSGTSSTESTQPILSSGQSTISVADKKTIDDILAMLPKPWLDAVTSLNLWNNLDLMLGIAAIAKSGRSASETIGITENAIVLAALDNWLKSEETNAARVKELIKKDPENPLVIALQNFIIQNSTPTSAIAPQPSTPTSVANTQKSDSQHSTDIVTSTQFLKSSPLFLSALKSVDPDLVTKAYHIAEQELVLTLLDKWVEQEAQAADKMRQIDREYFIQNKPVYQGMMQDYIASIKNGDQDLSQPMISILLSGMMSGVSAVATVNIDPVTHAISFKAIDNALPVGQQPLGNLITSIAKDMPADFSVSMPQLVTEMTQIAAAVMIAAAYWSIPGAISLATIDPPKDEKMVAQKSAFSFAVTIAQFVNRPDFDAFVTSRLKGVVKDLSEPQYKIFTTALKIVMLSCALAAVEKTMMGDITGADFIALLEGKIPLADGDVRITLIKMIQDQLAHLPEPLQKELLSLLSSYLSYKPKLESLYDPTRIFLMMWNPRFLREAPLQHSA